MDLNLLLSSVGRSKIGRSVYEGEEVQRKLREFRTERTDWSTVTTIVEFRANDHEHVEGYPDLCTWLCYNKAGALVGILILE